MSSIINGFLALPFGVRTIIFFFILIFVIWKFLGKIILRIMSLIPFLLEKGFYPIYLLIESPIAALHQKYGTFWGRIDRQNSRVAKEIVNALKRWYRAWHFPKKIPIRKLALAYILCISVVAGPSLLKIDNDTLKAGERLYIRGETFCTNWLRERGIYASAQQSLLKEQRESEEKASMEIRLVVSGVNSALLVRDIPSTQNSTTLDRLQNNDLVIWRGQMMFQEADNGHIEPWVKIETSSGIEGWSRLYYLHPRQYEGIEFLVSEE